MSTFKLSLLCCITRSRVKAGAAFGPSIGHPMPKVRLLGVRESDLLVSGVGGKIRPSEIHTMVDSQPQKGIRYWTNKVKINVHHPCLEMCLLPFPRQGHSLWHIRLCFFLTHVNLTPFSPVSRSLPSLFFSKNRWCFFSRNNRSN